MISISFVKKYDRNIYHEKYFYASLSFVFLHKEHNLQAYVSIQFGICKIFKKRELCHLIPFLSRVYLKGEIFSSDFLKTRGV